MELAYAAADLVVGRSGANTVCELTAVGLPAVYVPLPDRQRRAAAQRRRRRRRRRRAPRRGRGDHARLDARDTCSRSPPTASGCARWRTARPRLGERAADERPRRPGRRRLRLASMSGQPTVSSLLPQRGSTSLAQVPTAEDLGRVHFVAIGGAGMSGVARIMLARGMPVSAAATPRTSRCCTALASRGRRRCTSATTRRTRSTRRHRRHLLGDPGRQPRAARPRDRGAAGPAPRPGAGAPSWTGRAGSPSRAPTARRRRRRC